MLTDILSEIQKVRNSIPDFCPSDFELHMSNNDLKRLCEVCECGCRYSMTNTENCFFGLTIVVDDRAIKPTLMPKTDLALWHRKGES